MTEPRSGKIVTFYSYKGGTGRSMLLANVAWILASHRKRVLMVDWDLEAPGLHRYYHPFIADKYLASSPGLVDWVLDYQTAVSALDPQASDVPADLLERHADLTQYLISIDSSDLAKGSIGPLHLLPAGRQDANYPARFSDLDFQGLYRGLAGFRFFEQVKQTMKAQYDYVLIDSRTGVGDTSSICTMQMPDTLVVCFTLNSQSTVGASSIAKSVLADRKSAAAQDPTGERDAFCILPVPTRIERSEKQKLERARQRAYKAFDGFPTGFVGRDLERYWRSVEVPYEAYYAYEEVLAVFADQPGEITSVLAAAERLTRYVAGPEYQELVRIPDERRLLVLAKYSEADATVSVAERAERVYSGLSADQEPAARELSLWFVGLGAEDCPFARPVSQSIASRKDLAGICELFLAEGILMVSQPSPDNPKVYEFADASLVKSWSRIGDWLKEDLPFRRWYREFSAVARAWRANGRDSLLLGEKALAEASDWTKRFPRRLAPLEQDFLAESRRTLPRRRWTAPVRAFFRGPIYKQALIYFAIIAFGFAVYFGVRWVQREMSARSAARTEKAKQDANPPYNSGLQKYNSSDFSGAIADFSTALKYDPDYEAAWLKRGAAYRYRAENWAASDNNKKQADLRASLADLNKALAMNSGAEEHFERGWAYFDQGEYNRAAEDFKSALAIDKQYPEAHRGLAYVYDYQGQYPNCLSEANAALAMRPDYDDALYIRALCLGSRGDYESAIRDLRRVLQITPGYTDALAELGWELNRLGQYDASIDASNKALALYRAKGKEYAYPYENLGFSLLNTGKYTEAIADLRKAIQLGSTNVASLNDLIAQATQKLTGQPAGKVPAPSANPHNVPK